MILTKLERRIIADLLELASDKFCNHGCNDYYLPGKGLSLEERRELILEMAYENDDPDEISYLENEEKCFDYTQDWRLMSYFAGKLISE